MHYAREAGFSIRGSLNRLREWGSARDTVREVEDTRNEKASLLKRGVAGYF